MKSASRLQAYGCLTLAMIMVGSSVVVARHLVMDIPVFWALGLRFSIALIVVLPVLFRLLFKIRRHVRDCLILFCQAFFGAFLFNVFMLYGLKTESAALGGIMAGTTPIIMALIATMFYGERPKGMALIGIVISGLGILLANSAGFMAAHGGMGSLQGIVFIILAYGSEAVFLLLRKSVSSAISDMEASAVITLAGFLFFLPTAYIVAPTFQVSSLRIEQWYVLLYYGLIVTVAAYWFWFRGVAAVPASEAGAFVGVMPASGVLLAALILHEPLSIVDGLGCLFVMCGIIMAACPKFFFSFSVTVWNRASSLNRF